MSRNPPAVSDAARAWARQWLRRLVEHGERASSEPPDKPPRRWRAQAKKKPPRAGPVESA
jgi:hypothetical protein